MSSINKEALFRLGYGLYVLTAREDGKDNGCIINVCQQVTDSPLRVLITVNKQNLTHDMILRTARFNVTMLTEHCPFDVFKHFGFQSGKTVDKFEHCDCESRSANGIRFIPRYTNAYLSGLVRHSVDLGTHTLFIADVTESAVLSNEPSATYDFYQKNIKPKPQPAPTANAGRTVWVCQVCGHIYEGEELPDDIVCPLCKHGKESFIKSTI